MGTRSTIALEYPDGSVGQIYCHYDGYLECNGKILIQYYTDPLKVRALLERGDMSSLGVDVEKCDFYADRGEDNVYQRKYMDIDEYFDECQSEEYDYILTYDKGWLVRFCGKNTDEWVSLENALSITVSV